MARTEAGQPARGAEAITAEDLEEARQILAGWWPACAEDPELRRLDRRQLRAWLFDGGPIPSLGRARA